MHRESPLLLSQVSDKKKKKKGTETDSCMKIFEGRACIRFEAIIWWREYKEEILGVLLHKHIKELY